MDRLNNDLIVRSLNYHGQPLTQFMKDTPEFAMLNFSKVDYQLYQSRSKELNHEDRGKRMLLHRFISQNLNSLFRFFCSNVILQKQSKSALIFQE